MKNKTMFLISALILLILLSSFFYETGEKEESRNDFGQEYKIISPPLPKKISFCGERVPLENWDVKERFEKELIINTYYHSSTILYLKRASRWFPVIQKILRKYRVPDDFKYMAVAESGLENVVSDAGATGFWQLMKNAARKYGLEVNKQIDERYNVEKSTVAACKYLKDAKAKYGSWTLAAASYNLGTNGIDKQIEREKTHNYYNLVLNDETSRFVFRILAIKQVMRHPRLYGFDLKSKDLYPQLRYFVVKVNRSVKHWADFAKRYGYNYRILKMFNPWLRENYLKNKKRKTYYIKLPVKGSIKVIRG